jgi:endonuclease YncB( thermonuclease family)
VSLRRTCPLLAIVDTDTLQIEWDRERRFLRLIDVNPERALPGGAKQPTEFGRRTLKWAREVVFKDATEVTVEFPLEEAAYSNSGKLLAYVFVGGANINVRLVREGWTPCFNKYGHPRIHRPEMEQAEQWARYEGRGVWGGRGGRGDYRELKAYWSLRAGQVEDCRHKLEMAHDVLGCRRDYKLIVERARGGASGWVFSDIVTSFHTADGSTVMQLGSPFYPLSAFFPPSAAALAGFIEREHVGFGKPNYVYLNGTMGLAGEHPQIMIERMEQISTCLPASH